MEQNPPRLIVAGTGSGVGKTTVTLGLLAAMKRRGIAVQAYKAGPDYIDPGFHSAVTGRSSRNLDSWMLGKDGMREVFLRGASKAEVCVVEGVMGLFDGEAPDRNDGSTAEIAAELNTPVVLVTDASGAARSAAAVVRGFQVFDPAVEIGGVILNRVGSEGHAQMLKTAIEQECDIPVLGALPWDESRLLPERHLGLIPAWEQGQRNRWLKQVTDQVESHIDLDRLLSLARQKTPVSMPEACRYPCPRRDEQGPVIAVAKDEAFHFYYEENLELLRYYGAHLHMFSPLQGEDLPEAIDGLYLGGGFPEEFAERLSRQTRLMDFLRDRIQSGLPTYAEGGGFMFLCDSLTDRHGERYAMAGVIPAQVEMSSRLAAMGYREVCAKRDSLLLAKGETARGHEFHYSRLSTPREWEPLYSSRGSFGSGGEGYGHDRLLASYTHLHFLSQPSMARRWVEICRAYKRERTGFSP
ncbi:MAG: cobyrinate a,c-diamide synthase [Firmicutes bacterium]|nr:cobyrinate a,c-diamide synthase [Bacillota bacterium]